MPREMPIRTVLTILNAVFAVVGVILLIIAGSLAANAAAVAVGYSVAWPAYGLLAIGVLMLILAIVGIIGTKRMSRLLIMIFILVLILISILELAFCIAAFALPGEVKSFVWCNWDNVTCSSANCSAMIAVTGCLGIEDNIGSLIPNWSHNLGVNCTRESTSTATCVDAFMDLIGDLSTTLGIVGLVLLALEILTVALAFVLRHRILAETRNDMAGLEKSIAKLMPTGGSASFQTLQDEAGTKA